MKKLLYILYAFVLALVLAGCVQSDAGNDQTVYSGDLVTLDGTQSSSDSNEMMRYYWKQIQGRKVTLSGKNDAIATFVAPDVEVKEELLFSLIVRGDTKLSVSMDYVVIALKPREIAPPDSTPPTLTLLGESNVTIVVDTHYLDAGAIASDDRDGNLTDEIDIDSNVDTSQVGDYRIVYSVHDTAGNEASITRDVHVVLPPDTTKPVITLLGASSVTLVVGEAYIDAGATAMDDRDGDITVDINIANPVDTTTAGAYTVTYNVSDAAGNAAETVSRPVTVKEADIPVTISTQKESYTPQDTVGVTIGGTLSGDQDWAGVFHKDDNNSWANVIAWNWVNDGNNTLDKDMKAMPAGEYEARLFFHNEYGENVVARAVYGFTVGDEAKEYGKAGTHPTDFQPKDITAQTTVYFPTDLPEGKKAPVVFFASGWHAKAAEYKHTDYTTLLNFIASQGYYVIYLRQGWLGDTAIPAYQAALDAHIDHIDTTRMGVVGHSLGGGNTFKILDHFSKEKQYGENGRFIMVIEGWYAWEMNTSDMKTLPANTNIVMQQYGPKGNNAVNNTDPRIVLTEYYLLDSIPDNQKDYQVYENADHRYPYGDGPYSDMQIILKPLDALMDYTFNGTPGAHDVALEQGNDDPYAKGEGIQEVKPTSAYGSKCYDADIETDISYCDIAQWYSKKQLILHQKGHWLPSMAPNFVSRKDVIDALPFSGFTMVGNSYTNEVMRHDVNLSYADIWAEVKDVKDMYPNKSNFLAVHMYFPGDFWDKKVWDKVIGNFATLATVARDLGFAGIIYDDEAYSDKKYLYDNHNMINYKQGDEWYDKNGYKNPNFTFEEHMEQITKLFKQIMEAMVDQYPSINVLYYHSPVEAHIKGNRGIVGEDGKKHPVVVNVGLERQNEFKGPMFVGLKQGLSHQATLHDMGEDYRLRTQKHFDDVYEWRKHTIADNEVNDAIDQSKHWTVPQDDRDSWANDVQVDFMVSNEPLDSDYQEFNTTQKVSLNEMKTTLERALDKSDKYVTFYSASSSDGKGGLIQLDWLNDPNTITDDKVTHYSLDPAWKDMVQDVYDTEVLK